jgi:pseudouridylate synthase
MLVLHPEVRDALESAQSVVALESTLIAHGLPYPINLKTARAAEAAVRGSGAIPATIAVLRGNATIGLTDAELEMLAQAPDVRKASRRDLAAAMADAATAATTVAATLFLAYKARIRVFATGGIGGVHPVEADSTNDVSSDLVELARTPVAVVCAGAKSILDLPATLEVLETLSVPVIGFGTSTFPAFYCITSGLPLATRHDQPEQTARLLRIHWALDGGGVLVAQPPPEADALPPALFADALAQAVAEAQKAGVRGPRRTPFLLQRLVTLTQGQTLRVNQSLIEANASLAGRLALAFSRELDHASAGHR